MASQDPPVLARVEEARALVRKIRHAGRPVILVPTMGDLHEGHLSLVRLGTAVGDVVVSIFVNPTQFGPHEDFDRYPRDLPRDLERLAPLGVRGVFAPAAATMYPEPTRTWVEVEGLTECLCGVHRPGHFRGVTTVVAKLLQIVQPDVAVFGQKDAQQCLVIHRMVRDLNIPVHLLVGATVREEDGLALSSRNRYLSAAERREATRLPKALASARRALEEGKRDVDALETLMRDALAGLDVDYAELRLLPGLEKPAQVGGRMLLAVAARVGAARLIDNLCLTVTDDGVREAPLWDASSPQAVSAALDRASASTEEIPGHG